MTFNIPPSKQTVPTGSWPSWSSPPQSESATPPVLFTHAGTQILNLSVPASVFGFELESNNLNAFTFSVDFFSGNTLVGSITRDVNGVAGALLFAGRTCGPCIDKIVITGPAESGGFAIAQVRYTVCQSRGVRLSDSDIEL